MQKELKEMLLYGAVQGLIIMAMIIIIVIMIIWLGNQLWAMQLLKNQCIAECMEINKLHPNTCVC